MMSAGSRGLGTAALISWLLAESLGAYMLRSWLRADAARPRAAGAGEAGEAGAADAVPRQQTASLALILGHAGLALGGLVSWVSFVLSGLPVLAWLAVGLLAPAIGLGISTVTIWTPYPARPPESGQHPRHGDRSALAGPPAILVTNEMLDWVLANEALTSELVDDLVERMLAEPPSASRASRAGRGWGLASVIPVLHGGLALTTFLLAVLAAIAAGA